MFVYGVRSAYMHMFGSFEFVREDRDGHDWIQEFAIQDDASACRKLTLATCRRIYQSPEQIAWCHQQCLTKELTQVEDVVR